MTAALAPLVPVAVRRLLAADALGAGPTDVAAVVLFSDVTGYSRLCADLVAHDPRGAEAVGRLMNGLTGAMADSVRRHGGSVLALVGDALIAVWTLDDAGAAASSRLALSCAQDLHRLAAGQTLSATALRLRITLDLGPVRFAELALAGGRRVVHAGGAVIDRVGPLGRGLGPGETGVTAAVAAAVAGHATLGALRPDGLRPAAAVAGLGLPALPAVPEADLDRYVAPTTAALVAAFGRAWLAEFRLATILIVQLRDPVPDDLAPALTALSAPVAEAGGEVLSLATDDKGVVAVAVWGLAMSAHEDDGERAVHAALRVAAALAPLGLVSGLGLARGKVFAGLVGGEEEQGYTVVGDAVNLASALAGRSAGEVLADAATAGAAARRFRLAETAPILTKGGAARAVFRDPVEADAGAGAGPAQGFVGRSAELDRIARLMAPSGDPARAPIVVVEGEAGIGKSRLSQEIRCLAGTAGRTWIPTAADSLRRSVAYHAWHPVLSALLSPDPKAGLARLAALRPALAGQLPLLNPVLPQPLPETAATAGLDAEARAALSREAILEALDALWPAPAGVLGIEDAHWLDSASWLLLADLRRKRPDICLVLMTRPLDPARLPRDGLALLRQPDTAHVSLGPLDLADAGRLAAHVLGVRDLPAALVRRIHERAEGHPLYTAELALSLRDRGLVQTRGGLATVRLDEAGIDGIVFPVGLEAVIAERIAALDPAVQLTLKGAAVLGRDFDLGAVQAVRPGGLAGTEVSAHLDRLCASGLVDPLAGAFRFHHALIQDTVYGQLLRDQAADLHRAAALWTETQGGSTPVIAQHWSAAGDHDRALLHFASAARTAAASGALTEVVDFVARALDHAGKARVPPGRMETGRLQYLSGNAQRELGYYRRGAEALQASLAALHRPVPRSTLGKLALSVRELARLRFRRPTPAPEADRADLLVTASALHSLSEISYEHGDIPLTLSSLLSGLNQAQRTSGDSPELAKLLMGAAFVGLSAPWAIDPQATRTRAMEMCARLDDDRLWSWVLFIAANFELALGNCAEGVALAKRCVPICERTGEIKNWYTAVATLGNIRRVEGRLHESQEHDNQLLGAALDRGMVLAEVWARTALVKSDGQLNRLEALEDGLDRLAAIFADPANVTEGSTDNYMTLHLGYALWHSATDRRDAALASMAETARLFDTMKSPGIYGMEPASLMADMARLWHRRGADHDRLGRILKSTFAYAGRLKASYPGAKAKVLLVQGDLAELKGRPDKARAHWEKARTEAAARRLLQDEAQASRRLGGTHHARAEVILADLNLPWPAIWRDG